jgi:hypothetical protein
MTKKPKLETRYTIKELLAASDYSRTQPPEEREWIDAPSAGNEPEILDEVLAKTATLFS